MKFNKKFSSLIFVFALTFACFVPITVQASSSTIPTIICDFVLEGKHIIEEPYSAGDYSSSRYMPIKDSLSFKFDGECSLPSTKRYIVYFVDGDTDKIVERFYLYAINNQYKTFNNLTSSNYYIKFGDNYNSDIGGKMYVSSDNLFY